MPPRALVAGLACLIAIVGIGSGLATAQTPSSPALLSVPHWPSDRETTGTRHVVLQPLAAEGERVFSRSDELAVANRVFEILNNYYQGASSGRLEFASVTVAPPHVIPAPATCTDLIQESYELWDRPPANSGIHTVFIAGAGDCRYGGLGSLFGHYIFLPSQNPHTFTVNPNALVHEMGHNIGLPHAPAYTCAAMAEEERTGEPGFGGDCPTSLYGDTTDPMGAAGYTVMINPWHRHALGWGDGLQTAPEFIGTRMFTLAPAAEPKALDGLVVATPEGRILVSLRQPVATNEGVLDSALAKVRSGVTIHYLASEKEREAPGEPLTYLVPFTDNAAAGRAGAHYLSPARTFSIYVSDVEEGAATVVITMDPAGGITDVWAPAIDQGQFLVLPRKRGLTFSTPLAVDATPPISMSAHTTFLDDRGKAITSTRTHSVADGVSLAAPRQWRAATVKFSLTDGAGNSSSHVLQVQRPSRG